MQQNHGDADALLHASGVGADFMVTPIPHVHGFQNVLNPRFAQGFIQYVFEDALIIQEVPGGHVFIGAEFLGQVADEALKFFPVQGCIVTVDENFSIALVQYAAKGPHHGGFAGSIGTKQSDHSAGEFYGNAFDCFERGLGGLCQRYYHEPLDQTAAQAFHSAGDVFRVQLTGTGFPTGVQDGAGDQPKDKEGNGAAGALPALQHQYEKHDGVAQSPCVTDIF